VDARPSTHLRGRDHRSRLRDRGGRSLALDATVIPIILVLWAVLLLGFLLGYITRVGLERAGR
jgi:hypothetical protein